MIYFREWFMYVVVTVQLFASWQVFWLVESRVLMEDEIIATFFFYQFNLSELKMTFCWCFLFVRRYLLSIVRGFKLRFLIGEVINFSRWWVIVQGTYNRSYIFRLTSYYNTVDRYRILDLIMMLLYSIFYFNIIKTKS